MRYLLFCLLLTLSIKLQAQKANQLTLSIYPNPTNEFVNLRFSENLPSDEIVKITITDILGNKIRMFEFRNETECRFSMSEMNAGAYLCKVETKNLLFVKKILYKP